MNDSESGHAPDPFDRQLSSLHENPEVIKTAPSSKQVVPLLGVGGAQMFHIQTYRNREKGDYIVLQVSGARGTVRLILPPEIANTIARQREALVTKVRRTISKAAAEDRKAQGIEPAFMKGRK